MDQRALFILPLEGLAQQFQKGEFSPYAKPLPQDVGIMVIDRAELQLFGTTTRLADIDLFGKHIVKAVNRVVAGGAMHTFITVVAGPGAGRPTKQMFEAVAAYALGLRGNRMCGLYPQEGAVFTVLASSDRKTLVYMEGVRDTVRVEQGEEKAVVLLSSNGLHVVFESGKFEIGPVRLEGGIEFVGIDSMQRPITLFDGRPVSVFNGVEPIVVRLILGNDEVSGKKTLLAEMLESAGIKTDAIFVGNVEGGPQQFAQIVDGSLVFFDSRRAMVDLTRQLQAHPTHH